MMASKVAIVLTTWLLSKCTANEESQACDVESPKSRQMEEESRAIPSQDVQMDIMAMQVGMTPKGYMQRGATGTEEQATTLQQDTQPNRVAGQLIRCGIVNGTFVIEDPNSGGHETRLGVADVATLAFTSDPNVMQLTQFSGRFGNNIFQLSNALLFCHVMKIPKLRFPPDSTKQLIIYDLPEEMGVKLNAKVDADTRLTKKLLRLILHQHLSSLMTKETKLACQKEGSDPFPGLTVHLRTGDIWDQTSRTKQYVYAPCSFLTAVTTDHRFDKVRIVTEPDMKHPCIESVSDWGGPHVSMVTQSKSIEEDACAIMNARHLAVGSRSTFVLALELLNQKIESMFLPWNKQPSCLPPNVTNSGRIAYNYEVEGIGDMKYGEEKVNYIKHGALRGVSFKEECDEEQMMPWEDKIQSQHFLDGHGREIE